MARTRRKNKNNKNKNSPLARRNPATAMRQAAMQGMSQQAVEYLRLLSDPCHGKLVQAPYAGMGSSMLVRTTDYYQFPVISGAAATGFVDLLLEWTPWNYPVAFVSGSKETGAVGSVSMTNKEPFIGNFILSPVVNSYRPIAGCLKWIPTGPVAGRGGLVGLAYSASKTIANGDIVTPEIALSVAQKVDSNGSAQHEIRWLPSFGDERFSKYDETNINGAGSIQFIGKGIDAVGGAPNGVLELTVVWEWVPVVANSITSSPAAPSSTTLQSVLSRIKDVGAFLRGANNAIHMGMSLVGDYTGTKGPAMLQY